MTHTRGNIIVENIKIGDIHYEFDLNIGIKCEVVSQSIRNIDGLWTWESKSLKTGKIINYGVSEENSAYAPKLYDYEAYKTNHWI